MSRDADTTDEPVTELASPRVDEDRLAELLATFDEQLAAAASTDDVILPDTDDTATQQRLRKLQGCLRLIETTRRRSPDSLADLTLRDLGNELELSTSRPASTGDSIDDEWIESFHGKPLGRFRVERELGRGGYGAVFLATDLELDRQVAVKIPHPEALITAELRRRFFNEARAAAHLSHANIVPVFETGRAGAICFIAFAYCPGPTLEQWLRARREPVAVELAARIIATLAEAIQHAHGRGVLHRDLKPANVLIENVAADARDQEMPANEANGRESADQCFVRRLRIADFGLAKFLDSDSSHTRTLAIVGTPAYMSPEQAEARHAEIGPAADIYALGAMFYELLVGRAPFGKDSHLATLEAVRTEEPVRPRRIRQDVPRDLEAVCLKCLEKAPARRYANGSELAADLQRFLAGEPVRARRARTWERTARWCRRNPLVALLASTVSALLLVMAIGSTLAAIRFRAQGEEATRTSIRATNAEAEAREARDLSQRRLFQTLVEQSRAKRLSQRAGQRFESLQALGEAVRLGIPFDDDMRLRLRDEAIASLMLPDLQPDGAQEIAANGIRSGVAFDPSAEHYAFGDDSGRAIVIRRFADNHEVARLQGRALVDHHPQLRFSGDGKRLAAKYEVDGQATIAVWTLPDAIADFEAPAAGRWHDANFDFTADSRQLIVADAGGTLVQYDAATGERIAHVPGEGAATALALHRVLPRVAVYRDRRIDIVDLTNGRTLGSTAWNTRIESLAFSPDGRTLAAADLVGRVLLWNARSMKLISDAQPLMVNYLENADVNQTVHVEFSKRGDLLASSGWDGTTRLWDPILGTPLLKTPGFAAQFNGDDSRLAGGKFGATVNRWRVAPRREYFVLAHERQMTKIRTLLVDPTGRLIGAATIRGVSLWDLNSGETVAFYPFDNSRGGVTYDRVGKQIVTNGPLGLQLWGVGWQKSDQQLDYWFSLPQDVPKPKSFTPGPVAAARHAPRLVVGMRDEPGGLFVVDHETRRIVRELSGHPRLYYVDISPDGRYIATGTQHGRDVKIWNVTTGNVEKTIPCGSANVAFSPDGKTLVVAGSTEYTFWETNAWTNTRSIKRAAGGDLAGFVAFDAGGDTVALTTGPRGIMLAKAKSLDTLATFTVEDAAIISSLTLSDDARHLAAGMENGLVHVWNLERIEQQLTALGLEGEHLLKIPPNSFLTDPKPVRIRARIVGEVYMPVPSH